LSNSKNSLVVYENKFIIRDQGIGTRVIPSILEGVHPLSCVSFLRAAIPAPPRFPPHIGNAGRF
jgi:hypothetical protein